MHTLSNDQLRRKAPSIFATEPYPGVSARYGFVPTIHLVNSLRDQGWFPVRASQTATRDTARLDCTRHLIRFRSLDRQLIVGDCLPELVLSNSHDTSSRFSLEMGLFRVLCSNGLLTPMGKLGGILVRHGCSIIEQIEASVVELAGLLPGVAEVVDRFQRTELNTSQEYALAEGALAARYGNRRSPIRPRQLLIPRHPEDYGHDMWTVFNVVQENLFQGGLEGRGPSGRRVQTRRIRSVTADIRLNRTLWGMAERLAGLPQPA